MNSLLVDYESSSSEAAGESDAEGLRGAVGDAERDAAARDVTAEHASGSPAKASQAKKRKATQEETKGNKKFHIKEEEFDFFGLGVIKSDQGDASEEGDTLEEEADAIQGETTVDPSLSYEAYAAQFTQPTSLHPQEPSLRLFSLNENRQLNAIPEFQADKRNINENKVVVKTITTDDLMSDTWRYAATRDALMEAESTREHNRFQVEFLLILVLRWIQE